MDYTVTLVILIVMSAIFAVIGWQFMKLNEKLEKVAKAVNGHTSLLVEATRIAGEARGKAREQEDQARREGNDGSRDAVPLLLANQAQEIAKNHIKAADTQMRAAETQQQAAKDRQATAAAQAERVLAEAKIQAERLLAEAKVTATALDDDHATAVAKAEHILAAAKVEAEHLLAEAKRVATDDV